MQVDVREGERYEVGKKTTNCLISFLQVTVWNECEENGLTVERQFKLSNTILSISCHSQFVTIGSISIQLYDTENFEWNRTLADDVHEDESLEVIGRITTLLLCKQ